MSDVTKFKLIDKDIFKLMIQLEDKINRFLRSLKTRNIIEVNTNHDLLAKGSQPDILYGLPKVHKPDNPIRLILSAIGTHNYNFSNVLISFLSPWSTNEYTVKTVSLLWKKLQTCQTTLIIWPVLT